MVSLPRDHKAEFPRNGDISQKLKSHKIGRSCAETRQKMPKIRPFPFAPIFPRFASFPLLPKTFHTQNGRHFPMPPVFVLSMIFVSSPVHLILGRRRVSEIRRKTEGVRRVLFAEDRAFQHFNGVFRHFAQGKEDPLRPFAVNCRKGNERERAYPRSLPRADRRDRAHCGKDRRHR